MTSDRLDKIRAKYRESLSSKAQELEQSWRSAESSFFTDATIDDLRGRVHNLGGSAGMYGYDRLAQLAKSVETRLLEKSTDSATWRTELRDQVGSLIGMLKEESV